MKNLKLLYSDTFDGVLPILANELKGKTTDLETKNIIFCESKLSLSCERTVVDVGNGTFNTIVTSFGKYLLKNVKLDNVLSKEGSVMAIKKILLSLPLKCFKSQQLDLSSSVYNLISQLKSAKVSVSDLKQSAEKTEGLLKNKLEDIVMLYNAYEEFIKSGYIDQSNMLDYLLKYFDEDENLKNANVYLVGYNYWTRQIRALVEKIVKICPSVTCIFTSYKNENLFLNETSSVFIDICKKLGYKVNEERRYTAQNEVKAICDNLFMQHGLKEKIKTDKIFTFSPLTPYEEISSVARTIKSKVLSGEYRYKDFTLSLSNEEEYKETVLDVFSELDIPCFLDCSLSPKNHPLIKLIESYMDIFIKKLDRKTRLDRKTLFSFILNPIICDDKDFLDRFWDYLVKYKIDRKKLYIPFDLGEYEEFESFRKKIFGLFDKFDIDNLLKTLNAEEKCERFAAFLEEKGEREKASLSKQIFNAVKNVLSQEEEIIGSDKTKISVTERKAIFSSAISSFSLSIIPQYNDAVFIGGFKETSFYKAKVLFVVGLNGNVPKITEDVSLLNDTDISVLEEFETFIEPKIKVVNDREKQNVGMAVCAFYKELYLSCPQCDYKGKPQEKSVVLSEFNRIFSGIKEVNTFNGYLTKKQGLKTFAQEIGEIRYKKRTETEDASAFFYAENDVTKKLFDYINSSPVVKINRRLIEGTISPSVIESYHECPYRSFCQNVLHIEEKDEGDIKITERGIFVHDVLENFVKEYFIDNNREVVDTDIDKIISEVSEKDDYKGFNNEGRNKVAFERLKKECKKHCKNSVKQINGSRFKPFKSEVYIGKNGDYEPIKIDEDVLLTGRIDRLDKSEDGAYRVIDYKTGGAEMDDKAIYTGQKLQLLLYASVLPENSVKGLYYVPLSDNYKNSSKKPENAIGKTVKQEKTFSVEEENGSIGGSSKIEQYEMEKYIEYSKKIAKKGAERLKEGVIVHSPIDNACKYCPYSGMCEEKFERDKVDSDEKIKTLITGIKK